MSEPTTETTAVAAEQHVYAAGYAAGLRELADWVEAHPELIQSGDLSTTHHICRIEKEQFVELARALGPGLETDDSGNYYTLIRRFGPVRVILFIDPKHIGAPQTATREVTEWVLDDDVRSALEATV